MDSLHNFLIFFIWILGTIVYVYARHFDLVIQLVSGDDPLVLKRVYTHFYLTESLDFSVTIPNALILIFGLLLDGLLLWKSLGFALSIVKSRFATNNQISLIDGDYDSGESRVPNEHR